jgi:TATA-binding protein-associated factor
MPNFLGSSAFFAKQYAGPITKSQLPGASASSIGVGMEKLKILHQQVLPFILRREKEQVLKELPPKNIMDISCRLSEQQTRIYQAFLSGSEAKKSIAALHRYLADIESKTPEKSLSLGAEVLKSLLFLRLLCTHPVLVHRGCQLSESSDSQSVLLSASGKLLALSELLRDAGIYTDTLTAADNDTSLLYCADDSDQEESDDAIIESAELAPLSGTSGSGSGFGQRSKCLIFAQFSQSLDVLETLLFKPHMPSLRYLRLDGRVAAEKRTAIVDRFNRDSTVAVLLLTTRVGSLGLNLTGADMVVFLEHDYNPFADLQAMDRAHRLGQKSVVNVYRLILKDTIEEQIMAIQRKKVAVSNAIVNSDNTSMYSMGTDRLLDIFTFRSDHEGTESKKEESGYDLDALMEQYGEDYAALSVEEFVRNFRNRTD